MHEWKPLNVTIWDEWRNTRRTSSVLYNWILFFNLHMRLFHNGMILLRVNQHFLVPKWQDWDLTLSSFRFSLPFVVLWCRQLSSLPLSNLFGRSTVPFFLLQFLGWNTYFLFAQVEYLQEWLEIILLPEQQALFTWQICGRCSEMTITEG